MKPLIREQMKFASIVRDDFQFDGVAMIGGNINSLDSIPSDKSSGR